MGGCPHKSGGGGCLLLDPTICYSLLAQKKYFFAIELYSKVNVLKMCPRLEFGRDTTMLFKAIFPLFLYYFLVEVIVFLTCS